MPSDPAPVKVVPGVGTFVSAEGVGPRRDGRFPERAYGRVYMVTAPAGDLPPESDSFVRIVPIHPLTGSYRFDGAAALPGAQHAAHPHDAPNELVIWFEWAGPSPAHQRRTKRFGGRTASATEAEGGGAPPLLLAPDGTPVTPPPDRWRVPAEGFAGWGADRFNADWVLDRRPSPGGVDLWDNGGTGVDDPLVELRFEGWFGSPLWRLTFRCGPAAVSYTQHGADWRGLADQGITGVVAHPSFAPRSVPPVLRVVPAP